MLVQAIMSLVSHLVSYLLHWILLKLNIKEMVLVVVYWTEVLKKWLCQADSVESKGGPSYHTLIDALRSMEVNAAADGIDREKHPACAIFAHHQSDQSLQDLLPNLVLLLYKEGITNKIIHVPATGRTEVQLAAIQRSVCLNHENLEKFAAILKLFISTVSVGEAILNDYRKEFSDSSIEAIEVTDGEGKSFKIRIPRSMTPEFKAMQDKWTAMVLKVYKVVSVSMDNLKLYLGTRCPYLKPQLADCRTSQDILQLISERCSLIDVSLLEGTIEYFEINEAKVHIDEYKESVRSFCKEMKLNECINKKLSNAVTLHCTTVTFLVDRNVDEYTLKDIDDLTTVAFQNESGIEIVQVKKDNSFTIVCSFPLTLSESLTASALKNLEQLREKGLGQLKIGYSTVYGDDEVNEIGEDKTILKKSTAFSCDHQSAAAVYSSRGTLEQMVISLSVQLRNGKFELATIEEKYSKELNSLNEKQLAKRSEAEKEMRIYQAKLKKEIVSLQVKQKNMKEHQEELFLKKVSMEQPAEKSEAEKEVVIRLQEEIDLLTKQLALFIAEKDNASTDTTDEQKVVVEDDKLIRKVQPGQKIEHSSARKLYTEVDLSECSQDESLKLLKFVMGGHENDIPPQICDNILNSPHHSLDGKATLFFKCIKEDADLLDKLRTARRKYELGTPGKVEWKENTVRLVSPSPQQCREMVFELTTSVDYEVYLESSSEQVVLLLLPSLLYGTNGRKVGIYKTEFTYRCMQSLYDVLVTNESLKELFLVETSVTDEGVDLLTKALCQRKSTLTCLDLSHNGCISYISLCKLLRDSKVSELHILGIKLTPDEVLSLLKALTVNRTIESSH